MSRCNRCRRSREELLSCSKKGGGSYARPHRRYRAQVCRECVGELLAMVKTENTNTVEMFDVSGLRYAVRNK